MSRDNVMTGDDKYAECEALAGPQVEHVQEVTGFRGVDKLQRERGDKESFTRIKLILTCLTSDK